MAEGLLADSLPAQGNYGEAKRLAEHGVNLASVTVRYSSRDARTSFPGRRECAGERFKFFSQLEKKARLGSAYHNLAEVYAQQGWPEPTLEAINLALAEQIIPEALDLCLSRFGSDHPQRMIVLNNAASVYVAEKKYQQAEPLLREAAEIWPAAASGRPPSPQPRACRTTPTSSQSAKTKRGARWPRARFS